MKRSPVPPASPSFGARIVDALVAGLGPALLRARSNHRRRQWLRNPAANISACASVADSALLQFGPIGVGRIRIGAGTRIEAGAILTTYGGSIDIEDNVFIGPYCVVYGHGGVRIGAGSFVASHTSIVAVDHMFDEPGVDIKDQGYTARGISIGTDVWVGTGARVLDGVSIGRGTVVGAGTVVTHSLEEYVVAVGVPARIIRARRTAR